jgi:diphthamide biosynthesis protein 4
LKAWEVLRNAESRRNYDIELECKILSYFCGYFAKRQNINLFLLAKRNKKDLAIAAEVDLDDMEYSEEDGSFAYLCRCSGDYVITEEELENGIEVVGCNNCSLKIRVLYDVIEE